VFAFSCVRGTFETNSKHWISIVRRMVRVASILHNLSLDDGQISTDGSMLIFIKHLDGALSEMRVDPSDSIESIKDDIMARSQVAASEVILHCRGFGLREDFTIQEHGITSKEALTVQLAEEKDEQEQDGQDVEEDEGEAKAETIRQALLSQVCAEYELTSNGKSFRRKRNN